jgi:hypothetical protein
MLAWILQVSILSIIFIWLVHYLFNYFKDTLTVPKIKDLVNEPNKKYKNMYEIIRGDTSQTTSIYELNSTIRENILPPSINTKNPYTQTSVSNIEMKNELKNFLKKQINK